ncbi:MAG: response regulator [Steroidobacter sp.]
MEPLDVAQSFIERAARAASIRILAAAFEDGLADLGFGYFACCSHVDPLKPPPRSIMLHNYPSEWVRMFSERKLHQTDPVLLHAERTLLPFSWDAPQFRSLLTAWQRDVLTQAADLGLARGYTVPIHAPWKCGALHASCSVVPDSNSIDTRSYLAVQLMALHLYDAAIRQSTETRRTVLVVDDDAAIRRLLVSTLSEAGYDCVEVRNVAAARSYMMEELPDLILLDWILPNTSGLEYLRALKRNDGTREIPVIIVSSRASEQDRVDGLTNGADDYITKPVSERELIARIEALLRRCAAQRIVEDDEETHPISMGGLRLEPVTRRVYADGRNCAVGRTEFRMLQLLLANPDRVYSRRDLMNWLRGPGAAIDERTVDVYVRRLRRALAPFGYDKVVQTVHGSGYRLSEHPRK